jgi:hypothetical protein
MHTKIEKMLSKLKSQEAKQQEQVSEDLIGLLKTFSRLAEANKADLKWQVK